VTLLFGTDSIQLANFWDNAELRDCRCQSGYGCGTGRHKCKPNDLYMNLRSLSRLVANGTSAAGATAEMTLPIFHAGLGLTAVVFAGIILLATC
jgi:hypothetical protein